MPTAHHLSSTRIRYARGLARELAALDRLEHLPPEDRPSAIVADAVRLIREIDCSAELAARNASARALTILSRETRHA